MAHYKIWGRWTAVLICGSVLLLNNRAGLAQTNTNSTTPSSFSNSTVTTQAPPVAAIAPATNAPPATGLELFQVKRGFQVELVASEPAVASPAAIAFDEQGRLFVAEMRDYPDQLNTRPHLGRIRLLQDPEDKGEYPTNTIFADDLSLPAGLACYGGGVFVLSTPEVIYLKDTDGDGQADVRKVVFSGFVRPPQVTTDQYLNSLAWGLDNRIHGLAAGLEGNITGPGMAQPLALAGADFSFDPRTLALRRETGDGGTGLTFDNFGRKFVSDPTRPVRHPVLPRRYLDRNAFSGYGRQVQDVSLPAVAIYRPGSGTNRTVSGWMKHANGLTVYRGSAFPSNYVGSVFIPDRETGVIHREIIRDFGLEFYSERPADEAGAEFLTSRDPHFHPTQVVNGPDGCLYVSDFRQGKDTGRIYRIRPGRFERPKRIQFAKLGAFELSALLGHPNGWARDIAARMLYERKDPASAPILAGMLARSRSELTRLHVLNVLAGLDALGETNALLGLRDPAPTVREHGLRSAERLINDGVLPERVWSQVRSLASDASRSVRFQLALTVGQVSRADKIGVLAILMRTDPANAWLQAAVLSSVNQGPGLLFTSLASDPGYRSTAAGQLFLAQTCSMIGVRGQADEVSQVMSFISQGRLDALSSYALLRSLGEGLSRTGSSLALADLDNRLKPFFTRALEVMVDETLAEPLRCEAIRLAGVSSFTYQEVGDLLLLLLGSGQSAAIQSAVISTLGRFTDPRVAPNLFSRWGMLSPALRAQAVNALLSRAERIPAVMGALRDRVIAASDFSPVRVSFLRTYRDAAIAQEAVRFFGLYDPQLGNIQRHAPALKLSQDPGRGRELFRALCAECHRLNGEGREVGPDLAGLKVLGKEALLQAIAEPNLTGRPGFGTVVLETRVGENAIGILEHETPEALSLAQAGGGHLVWARPTVQTVQPQPWSIMPEGLLNGLSHQQIADLLGAIMAASR